MTAILVLLALMQQPPCLGDAITRAQAFDLDGAAAAADRARDAGCGEAIVASPYLHGLAAARHAYPQGGSTESLAPVREAIAALDTIGADVPGPAQIAKLVLMAAASAAQSERDEMAVFLDQALSLESLQITAHQPGAPALTAHEVAGDLWLQVHRFDEATRAYQEAAALIGTTPHIARGLEETAAVAKKTQPPAPSPPRRTPRR